MKIGMRFPGVLLCALVLSGCAPEAPKPAPSADWRENLPAPRIDSAVFAGAGMLRDTIQVKGAYFKEKSNEKDDLVVSTNGTIWVPPTKITDSSATSYVAILPYTANYPAVLVKVFGMNGHYSEPIAVTR
jgi:hypothetical protein